MPPDGSVPPTEPVSIPDTPGRMALRLLILCLRIAAAILVTFVFLTSVNVLSSGFKMAGSGAVEGLIETAKNPFVGLFVGILVTSVLQSSSATTSMLVGLVSADVIGIRMAIPIVMGANIGTTVTNTIVAMGHVTRPREFRRAVTCSTMHDFFNMLCVIVILPIELTTHILERSATFLSGLFAGVSGVKVESSPLKRAMKPIVTWLQHQCEALPGYWGSVVMVAIGIVVLFIALYFLTRILKSLMLGKVEGVLGGYLDKFGPAGIVIGAGATAAVQSSSVTTSFFVPLAAAGILKPRQIYPLVLGANIGTTITALLASLAGKEAGMTLAFTHLLFNIAGLLIFYPIPQMRIPIWLADRFGRMAVRHRALAVGYVVVAFYVIPLTLIFLGRRIF